MQVAYGLRPNVTNILWYPRNPAPNVCQHRYRRTNPNPRRPRNIGRVLIGNARMLKGYTVPIRREQP